MAVETSEFKNKIGEAIRKFRVMKRMSAADLAKKSGIAASNMSVIESGERIPKMDMCSRIAHALEADPVEICGLELSEVDEKRLLMKLLAKYANNIEAVMVTDKQGKVVADLPIDFADFAFRFMENAKNVEFALDGISEDDPRYAMRKAGAEDELNFWLDMYPEYDAYTDVKDDVETVDFDMVNRRAVVLQDEMSKHFWQFQSDYIIPKRNEEMRSKN